MDVTAESSRSHLGTDALRRSRSTGDIAAPGELTIPPRMQVSPTYRYSGSDTDGRGHRGRVLAAPSIILEQPTLTDEPMPFLEEFGPRRTNMALPSPLGRQVTGSMASVELTEQPVTHQHRRRRPGRLSFYSQLFAMFGYGRNASRARKDLTLMIISFTWGFIQVTAIVTLLVLAAHAESPTKPGVNEWDACGRPLGIWCCLWIVRVFIACGLSYWSRVRDRKARTRESLESGNANNDSRPRPNPVSPVSPVPIVRSNTTTTVATAGAASQLPRPTTDRPSLPHSRLYARLTLLSSLFTVTWFLTAHILEYTSIDTCRHSSPHLWYLTLGILCIMYVMVLEVVVLGFVVFIIAPIILIFWNIILICMGRHPLQNPPIRPEIGKLPKSIVDRIPLVVYIPPPPENLASKGPIAVPEAIYTYPPKTTPAKPARKRFTLLRSLRKGKNGKGNDNKDKKDGTGKGKSVERSEPLTWEDHWEQGEHPFVRLEGHRAACAICLMDFEEPRRLFGETTNVEANVEKDKDKEAEEAAPKEVSGDVEEIPVDLATEEEAADHLRLKDAGEGPQPLRLLPCGHSFHQTCIDPWLTDVSGRCPVCQRPVELPEIGGKKKRRGRGTGG